MRELNRRKVVVFVAVGRRVVMTSGSIIKIVASASAFVAACGVAFVFGLPLLQHDDGPAADDVTATASTPPAAPVLRSDTPPAATDTPLARPATQAPPALTAAKPDPAAIAADLAGPPDAGKDQLSPSFDVARVEADGDAVIAGRAPPGATVELMRGGERLDRAIADASGEFTMVPPRLPAGSYELTLSATLPDGTVTSSKHGAAVTINDPGPGARAAQSRAEYVPQTAPQSQPSSGPRVRTGQPQESAGLQLMDAVHASSSSGAGVSSPAAGHAISSRVISRGDSLWRISRITYGDGSRFALVYRANRDRIRNPNLIYPGQTLVLPTKRN